MGDATTKEEDSDIGPYIENDPLYLLLRDEMLVDTLMLLPEVFDSPFSVADLKTKRDITLGTAMAQAQVLDDINVLLTEGDRYVVNRQHPLVKASQQPNFRQLLPDEATTAVLATYIGKFAVPCITVDNLVHLTEFDEAAVEEANTRLRALDVIRGTMIIDGHDSRRNTVNDAGEVLSKVDALVDLLDAEERESVTIEEIDDIIGDIEEPDRDEDRLLGMTEDEFLKSVRKAAAHGAEAVETNDSIYTYDGGETGNKLNRDSELAELLYRASNKLIRHVEDVHAFADGSNNN